MQMAFSGQVNRYAILPSWPPGVSWSTGPPGSENWDIVAHVVDSWQDVLLISPKDSAGSISKSNAFMRLPWSLDQWSTVPVQQMNPILNDVGVSLAEPSSRLYALSHERRLPTLSHEAR